MIPLPWGINPQCFIKDEHKIYCSSKECPLLADIRKVVGQDDKYNKIYDYMCNNHFESKSI